MILPKKQDIIDFIYNIQFIHKKNRMTEELYKWENDNKYSESGMYMNNLKIMAQIKLFDKSRKLKELLVIQSKEATLWKALKPWYFIYGKN